MFNVLRRLDYVIGAMCAVFLGRHNAAQRREGECVRPVKKILCIKLWGLGNLVIIQPLLCKLKEQFPQAKLIFLTLAVNKDFIGRIPQIEECIYVGLTRNIFRIAGQFLACLRRIRKEQVDILINFETYNNVSGLFSYLTKAPLRIGIANDFEHFFYTHPVHNAVNMHITELFSSLLKAVHINGAYRYGNIKGQEVERVRVKNLLKDLRVSDFICIHPGTSENFKGKRYNKESFSKLADLLIEHFDIPVIFTGSRRERALVEEIREAMALKKTAFNLAGSLAIGELIELLKETRLLIANDTGPVHIAASLGINNAVFFGPSSPLRYAPLNDKSLIFYNQMACSPCVGNSFNTKKCPRDFQCLAFRVDDVFEAISKRFFNG
jgi:ADP-heptose:LPS heptosyltransferase